MIEIKDAKKEQAAVIVRLILPEYRRQGIASRLIKATIERANSFGLPCVGLLVDKGNPSGEALYSSLGVQYANDSMWGGHPMKHLTL